MAFSSSGTPISMKEHSLGVSVGPGVSVGVPSAGYATFPTTLHDFQGAGEFSQQQREFLAQRSMMSQAVEQHSQGHGQTGGHSQGQHINMNEGAKVSTVSTHDFLSLYADNSNQYAEHHDNTRGLSSALTTKDFLQPLERGNHATFREGQPSRGEKHSRQQDSLPHGSSAPPPAVVERLLSSGMGVYNGGHGVPSYGRVSKGAVDLPSNAMVRMVGESNVEMRGRGGFNPAPGPMVPRDDHDTRNELQKDQDPAVRGDNLAYWSNVRLKFGMLPPDLAFHPPPSQGTTHNVMDPQQPPVPNMPKQWPQGVQGVIDMTKRPIRVLSEDDEDDEEEYGDRPRETRKETFPKADPAQKVDGKAPENRGGTPRSKHSATEQRRRSKINDRFQMLRELVPHSDQKRDKASFLLEVIEYIQVLQEKVRKFEAAEHGRHQDRLKNMVWDLCKRSGSGPGDTSIEATCIDALAYAKEYASSAVSGLPVDIKQITEATDAGRQRGVSNADENGNCELLPHAAQHTHKTGLHGASAPHEEKEGSSGLGKPPLSSQQNQAQNSYNSRSLPHTSQSKQPTAASDAQANVSSEGQGQNSSASVPATGSHEQHDKPNEAEPPQQTRTQANSQLSQGEAITSEQQHSDIRHRQGTSAAEDTGNGHASFDEGQAKSHGKLDRQHGYGSSPRATHNSQATDSSQANWQGQQHGNLMENAQQREESRGAPATAQGQDPLTIQGGVINVSSVYSQGLLDTLTRALQSSGLDLSQANISVQIDLGKSISSASLPPASKASGQQCESSGQRHQAVDGDARLQGGSCTDPEHPPLKRPKLEMEL